MKQREIESVPRSVLAQRLKEFRNSRGLTQQEVSDPMGLARTSITAMEKSERWTRPEELIRLARLFKRSVRDFVGAREPIFGFAELFRTAVESLDSPQAQNELQEAVDALHFLCEDYLHLEKLNEAPKNRDYPSQRSVMADAPEDVASSARSRLALGDGPLRNLREILENHAGLRILFMRLPNRVASIYFYTMELGGCIAVNIGHPEARQNWSMAFEYGRFLTSRYRPEVSMLYTYGHALEPDRFADAFARCLLIPAADLRRRLDELPAAGQDRITAAQLSNFAQRYSVPVGAMEFRLEELSFLPRGRREWQRERSENAQETEGRGDRSSHSLDDWRLPLRYRFLVALSWDKGQLTEGELAQFLRVDRVTARGMVRRLSQSILSLDESQLAYHSLKLAGSITEVDETAPLWPATALSSDQHA